MNIFFYSKIAGLVGLALSYALSTTSLLNGLVSCFAETEKELISVERIEHHATQLPQEPQDTENNKDNDVCSTNFVL